MSLSRFSTPSALHSTHNFSTSPCLAPSFKALNLLCLVENAVDWERSEVEVRPTSRRFKWIDRVHRLSLNLPQPPSTAFRILEYRNLVILTEEAGGRVREAALPGVYCLPLDELGTTDQPYLTF